MDRCTGDFFARNGNVGRQDHTLVVILGMPRSGTTLVEQILSSHREIAGAGELDFWRPRTADWIAAGPNGFGPARAASLADEYLRLLRGIAPDARRVCDKTPWNFHSIGLIRQALPNARFIHCQRNPVDTCLSVYFTKFMITQAFMGDRGTLAFYYRQYARLMDHWRRTLPADRFIEVEYEALINDREVETRRLIAFCGLEWDDACLNHEANGRAIKTASFWQARQPVYRDSLERWRRYEPWLGELRELLSRESEGAG
jgi:hypothetical protein